MAPHTLLRDTDYLTFSRADLFDAHAHPRQGRLLQAVLPYTAFPFGYFTVMPNTIAGAGVPNGPVSDATALDAYRRTINAAALLASNQRLRGVSHPVMTIKLLASTTPETVFKAVRAGAQAVKYYPEGVTTHSEDGLSLEAFFGKKEVLEAIAEAKIPLLLHAETPIQSMLDREWRFIHVVRRLAAEFPTLRICVEHVSSGEMARCVCDLYEQHDQRIAATITPHHLMLTTSDVIGQPHNVCAPVAKSENDRQMLLRTVASGHLAFGAGTDSAPHVRSKKEAANIAFGVFHAFPVEAYATALAAAGITVDAFRAFMGPNMRRFYGLPEPTELMGEVHLEQRPTTVPREIPVGDEVVVPFMAGEELPWSTEVHLPV